MADIDISSTARRKVFSGSAGVGPYACTFEITAEADIAVYIDSTLKTLTTHYTVSIAGNGTFSVTFTGVAGALPTVANIVTVIGAKSIARSSEFSTGGDFFAATVNSELDSLVIFDQQLLDRTERALKAHFSDDITLDMTLPPTAERAGNFLSFDSNGEPIVAASSVDAALVSSFMETVLDDVDAATARATIGAAASGANTDLTSVYLNNTGLKVKDTNATHGLSIVPGSNLTADHVLTVVTGDADRTLTLSGNADITGTHSGTSSGTNTGDQTVPTAASQAEQETGSEAAKYVAPATQQFHPSALKGWACVTVSAGTPTLAANYNVSSVGDNGSGDFTINWGTDFSSANYGLSAIVGDYTSAQSNRSITVGSATTITGGAVRVVMGPTAAMNEDPIRFMVMAAGDQ